MLVQEDHEGGETKTNFLGKAHDGVSGVSHEVETNEMGMLKLVTIGDG